MPFYEYVCPKCELKFELRRSFSQANDDAPCPKCQSLAKRAFSTFVARDQWGSFVPGLGNARSSYQENTHKLGTWRPDTRKAGKRRTSK